MVGPLPGGDGVLLTSSIEDRRARAAYLVDELLGAYAGAVDERDFTAWLALFAPECAYEVRAMENVREGLPLAYMMDDCRQRLVDRVKMIQDVWASTVEPYDTRHLQQRTAMRGARRRPLGGAVQRPRRLYRRLRRARDLSQRPQRRRCRLRR